MRRSNDERAAARNEKRKKDKKKKKASQQCVVSLIIIFFFYAVDDESVLGSLPRQNTRLQCEGGGREKSNKTKRSPQARLERGEIHVFPVPFPLRLHRGY